MTINSVASSPYSSFHFGYTQKPDGDFFNAFQTHYQEWQQSKSDTAASTAPNALESVFGATHAEFQARRQVAEKDQERYAAILNQAYSTGAMDDPVKFLNSLSPTDLGVIQRSVGLADAINPGTLSKEGAYNLLLPEGYRVDFNKDGISEVGLAKSIVFPPLDAPQEFKDAWLKATENMSEMDGASYGLSLWGGLHPINASSMEISNGLPSDTMSSYRKLVNDFLASLDAFRGFLAPGQYERDKAFYTKLQGLINAA